MKGVLSGMGYSNLAYELYEEEQLLDEKKVKVKKSEKKVVKNFRPIIYALVLSMAAYYVLSKNVAVYETTQEIKQKQEQLAELESYTSQRIFELEQSVDLATVEKIATRDLNMQRPQEHQIEYVSIGREDVTEITAGEVEGVKNKVSRATNDFKRNIFGIFSLR